MKTRIRCLLAALLATDVAPMRGPALSPSVALAPRRRKRNGVKPYVLGCAAAGALSTCVSHTLTLPLDVLKTRIQSDAALAGLSLAAVCRRIVTKEGPRALLAGFTANGCGYFMQGAIKFGLYEACKRRIFRELDNRGIDGRRRHRVPVWVASSACAEVVACLALCPMEATKIRLVTDPLYASSTLGALRRVISENGIHSLWQGVAPILVRQVPYTVAKLAGYEVISQRLRNPLAAGVLAGSAAAVVSQPGDVVLARLCGGSAQARLTGVCALEDASVGAVLASITSPMQLFVGLYPRACMCAVVCASQFFLYEALRPEVVTSS